jgi:hypothetical protein
MHTCDISQSSHMTALLVQGFANITCPLCRNTNTDLSKVLVSKLRLHTRQKRCSREFFDRLLIPASTTKEPNYYSHLTMTVVIQKLGPEYCTRDVLIALLVEFFGDDYEVDVRCSPIEVMAPVY